MHVINIGQLKPTATRGLPLKLGKTNLAKKRHTGWSDVREGQGHYYVREEERNVC